MILNIFSLLSLIGAITIPLNQFDNAPDILAEVNNIAFRDEETGQNIKAGLGSIQLALLGGGGNRIDASDVVIAVVSGAPPSEEGFVPTETNLNALKNGGAEVFVVMHQGYADEAENAQTAWETVATDEDHFFVFADYATDLGYAFAQVVRQQMQTTCESAGLGAGVQATTTAGKSFMHHL